MDGFSPIINQVEKMVEDVMRGLPNIAVGMIVFLIFYFLSKRIRDSISYLLRRAGRSKSASLVFGRLTRWLTVFIGFMIAMTIALPSFAPSQLIEFLGIGSVAIGFAFRDILQNFLSGILILLSEPFRIGDQIVINDFEGTVEDIQIRATVIRTYDGRQVVIPNTNLFTGSVIVNTAYPHRRTQYDIGIGYGDDVQQARTLILEAVQSVEGVLDDPPPDAIVVELASSSVNIRARWWTGSRLMDVLTVQDQVIAAIKTRLNENGIDLPFPTQQILFHDQTEVTDGDRSKQREGWPTGRQTPPKSARIVDGLRGLQDNHQQKEE